MIGGGSFGTALALVLARKGYSVSVWARSAEQANVVNGDRENKKYLPGYPLPTEIQWNSSVEQCVKDVSIILLVIPTQYLRGFLESNRSTFPVGVPIVLCAKGIELQSQQTPYEILHDELPGKYRKHMAVLAGPSFAKEMAQSHPTFVTVAAHEESVAREVQRIMSSRRARFRVYTSDDVMGCEISGACKNVLAIASGFSSGIGFGNNTRAALICRGMAEIRHLAKALGSSCTSLPGLAGIGDLLLTCSSELSRNFTVGKRLAQGEKLAGILSSTSSVAEGVPTAKALKELSKRLNVSMPICSEVFSVLYEDKNPVEAMNALQARPLTHEFHQGDGTSPSYPLASVQGSPVCSYATGHEKGASKFDDDVDIIGPEFIED